MKEVVIVSAVRTPVGNFAGTLKDFSTRKLGAAAVKAAMERAGIKPEQVDEVILGCVLQGGLGQNIARQIAMDAGIPKEVPSMTINKVCGSGVRAVALAAQIIKAGDADCIITGGAENMSMTQYAVPTARTGTRIGDAKMTDMMIHDGLTDAFYGYHMGVTTENIVEKYGITREAQDEFAVTSQQRAEAAIKAGKFKDEIVPLEIPQKKGDPLIFDTDEYPKFGASLEKMSSLKPAFKAEGGSVTAANASGLNDGAAVLIVMSKEKADELGIKPLCTIVSYASAGVDPSIMGIGPVPATKKALAKAGLTIKDIDLVEANEAFAAQSLAVAKDLEFDMEKTNVNGGAIALGHPIGASGARILVTLIHEMKKRGSKTGLATLCIGGGQGTAIIIKMEN